MILFIKHIDIEGPETSKDFFEKKGFQTKTVELQDGDPLPENLNSIDAVISLGGPMNVYEEEKYPFLKDEHIFLKKIIDQEIPFIGICLGSQLLAKASGAKVGKSPQEEIGFFAVQFTADGKGDPLFKGLDERINVFQWHNDMFQLPAGAKLLAASQKCPHQAFRVGPAAYGLQFHIEVTQPTVKKWAEAYFSKEDFSRQEQTKEMMDEFRREEAAFCETADTIYGNFMSIIYGRKNKKASV